MPTEIVYEIGINANGYLDTAKKMIDVAHSAGCNYVKFQKRHIESVYTQEELNSPRKSRWGTTFREQKLGLEFGFDDYQEIDQHCSKRGIGWFASPWDLDSMDFLEAFDRCKYIKIASPMLTNEGLLKRCKVMDKLVILSTGMSTMGLVDNAVRILGREKIYAILHCTSTYPSKPEELNLNCITTFKQKYPWAKIGFSNHNSGVLYMPIAVALGAEMIEFHGTLDRASEGSDQSASIEPEGVFRLVKYIRGVEKAMGTGEKFIYDSEIPILKKLRR